MNIFKRVWFGFKVGDTKKHFPTQNHYCISYHDPRSITWSWLFWWTPPWRLKRNPRLKPHHKVFGFFHFARQDKMIVNRD
ncbi:hypothetical protein VPHK460_0220 [Vibrio phage K460]